MQFDSWEAVGSRIAEARSLVGLTQDQLGEAVGLGRTAVSKIESGRRQVDSLELARFAEALGRPLDWFVSDPPQAILRWRSSSVSPTEVSASELILEDLARDIELLQELGSLSEPEPRGAHPITDLDSAIAVATSIRAEFDLADEPVDLYELSERLGLFAFVLNLIQNDVDGAYVALTTGGIALVNGIHEPGRRRFTLAHKIGHYVAQDEFRTD